MRRCARKIRAAFCEAITIRIPTLVILILALIAIVCVISYVSDNMGKNLGKKRLSILGLRPRQTATLLSMLTSVLIMLLTLGVLTIFSEQVRTAILRSDRLLQSNEEQRTRIARYKIEARRLEREQSRLEAQRNRLKATVKSTQERAKNAVAEANTRVGIARRNASAAEGKLSNAQNQLSSAQQAQVQAQQAQQEAQAGASAASVRASQATTRAEQAQSRFAAAQSRLGAAQSKLNSAQTRLSAAQFQFQLTDKRLTATNERLAQANERRRQADEKAARATGSANRAAENANKVGKQILLLGAQSAELTAQNAKAQAELQEATAAFEQAQANLDQVVKLATQVGQTTYQIDTGDVSINRGQVFADTTIPANTDALQARSRLRQLLDEGARAATKIGAEPYLNPATGITRALHLAPLPLASSGANELDEEAIITNFANRLATFEVPVSVRLVAGRSYARGETQMEARLVEVPVRRVYLKGDTIALVSLPPNQKDFQIFSELLKLADKGAELARGKGVQPLLSAQSPNLFADDTNQRIFEAIRRIQQQPGAVTVRLVAARDVSTVDSIRVRFDIGNFS